MGAVALRIGADATTIGLRAGASARAGFAGGAGRTGEVARPAIQLVGLCVDTLFATELGRIGARAACPARRSATGRGASG
jgi:hypothetical protein